MRFPRLESLLGVPPEALDIAALERAVDLGVQEGADLDWKQELYARDDKGKAELAKDVAALANAVGGVLVLGVRELNGRAAGLTPVPLSEGEQRRMREIVAERVRPFVAGLDIRQVASREASIGFFVLVVPRSADAPHAVRAGSNLGYPFRNEETTRWLSETEVAVQYRDRFSARDALSSRVREVHEQGAARLQRWLPAWLVIAAAPTSPGLRASGAAATARGYGFVQTWARTASPAGAVQARADGGLTAVPGVRRVLLSSAAPYAGVSDEVHVELHHDGACFAATVVGTSDVPQDGAPPPPDVAVGRERLEIEVQELVSLAVQHAVDVGAGGELLLLGQLLLPRDRWPGQGPTPTAVHARRFVSPGLWLGPERVPASLVLTQTTATSSSALLSEAAASARDVVRISYLLAADILAEFGVAEPSMLRSDGTLRLDATGPYTRSGLDSWALQNELLDLPSDS